MHSYEIKFSNRGGKEYRVIVNKASSQLSALSKAIEMCGKYIPTDVCEVDITLVTPVDVI